VPGIPSTIDCTHFRRRNWRIADIADVDQPLRMKIRRNFILSEDSWSSRTGGSDNAHHCNKYCQQPSHLGLTILRTFRVVAAPQERVGQRLLPSTIIGAITIGLAGSGRGKRADTIRVVSFFVQAVG